MVVHTYFRSAKVWLGLMAAFVLMLAGCGGGSTSEGSSEGAQSEPAAEESVARDVTHAMGTTTIEGTPERIVTLYQGATDSAVEMGVTPVGVVESWLEQPMYHYLKEDLGDVTIVGQETQPNLEEIAKLEPDLIIGSKLRHEEIYEQLSQIAPTVMHETVFDFKGTVELMGDAMNQTDKSAELLAAWEERVADFQGKASEKLGGEWPMSAAVLNFRADHARVYVTGFAGSILTELGFEGPQNLSDPSLDVVQLTDKEAISQMNADSFYIFMEDDAAVKKTYEEWTSHPLWAGLDAVKADKVYTVDEVIWNMGGGIRAANLMLDDLYDRFELEQ